MNHRAIAQVLASAGSYDTLGELEQAIVREECTERLASLSGELNIRKTGFVTSGESYSEVDEDGCLSVHPALTPQLHLLAGQQVSEERGGRTLRSCRPPPSYNSYHALMVSVTLS